MYALRALIYQGELIKAVEVRNAMLREADERGNLLLGAALRSDVCILLPLAVGDVDQARIDVAAALGRWTRGHFNLQHLNAARARAMLLLYEGRAREAIDELTRVEAEARRSWMDRVQLFTVMTLELKARAALAAAWETNGDAKLERMVLKIARKVDRLSVRPASAQAAVLRAGVDALRGRTTQAADTLKGALETFEKLEMGVHAAATRYRLGAVIGGGQGRRFVGAAEGWLRSQGVAEPGRLASLFAPGPPATPIEPRSSTLTPAPPRRNVTPP